MIFETVVAMVCEYVKGMPLYVRWAFPGIFLALLLSFPSVRRALIKNVPIGVLIVALPGLVWAWHLKWVGDDAFISFRYARNLARGLGLVFNAGERVEGYTNFLWTVMMSGGIVLGLDPAQVSVVLSLLCFAGVIFLTHRLAGRICPGSVKVSIASILLAANYTFASFATGGLETMFAVFLVTLALERGMAGRPLEAGFAGIAAVMAHPDHAIFYVALGVTLLSDRERRKGVILYALPFLVVYLPYFLWRWHYYGDFFPNTFYTKSADRFYFGQGIVYTAASLVGGGLWGTIPLVLFAVFYRRKDFFMKYFMTVVPLYLFYVLKIGGDFMYGRLFCPILPLLFLAAEAGARELWEQRRLRDVFAGVALLPAVVIPVQFIKPGDIAWHLADERTHYELASFSPIRVKSSNMDLAESLNKHIVQRGLRPVIGRGTIGIIGYYNMDLPIIDIFGLTDRHVARQPIDRRDRPGHEKIAGLDYLRSRGVVFSDSFKEFPVWAGKYKPLTTLSIGGGEYCLLYYDKRFLRMFKGDEGVRFTEMEGYLDKYLRRLDTLSPEEVRKDLEFFREYYFEKNPDPVRFRKLTAFLDRESEGKGRKGLRAERERNRRRL